MKDLARVYNLYGLRVYSEVGLNSPIAQRTLPPYDIEVRWGKGKVSSERTSAGEILAKVDFGNGRGYTLTDTGTGYIYCSHQMCEFWIDYNLHSVYVHLFDGVCSEIAGLLLEGNIIASILTLAGECILHASAVTIGSSALAFVGGAGMGKSTLAALLCANGGRFITDDLLRLQANGTDFCCFPGTGQIRLHKDIAESFVEGFSAVVSTETLPDARIGVKIADDSSMPPLAGIVIPYPSPDCKELKLERLSRSMALLYLMAFPRVQWLQERKYLQRRLDFFGCLTTSIPIFKAEIPWRLPFSEELVHSLLRGVGITLGGEVGNR